MRDFWKKEKVIILIALATFILSAGYAFFYHIRPAVDASAYDQIGWNIAQGLGYRLTLNVPIEQDEVITYQGPFYPIFLSGIYSVFGHSYYPVWIIQALLRALSAVLVYAICSRIFEGDGRRIGWIAAAIFGAYPDLVEIGSMLMSETVFIFFMLLIIWLFVRMYERPRLPSSALLGAIFGTAVLTRSSILLFGLVFAYWFWKRKALSAFIVFCLVVGAMLLPWTIRNAYTYHAFIPTMANAGYNMYVGNHVGATGEGGNPPEILEAQITYGMLGANAYFITQYKQFVVTHPFKYAELTASRFMKYFSVVRPMGFWFYQTGLPQMVFVACSALASFLLFVLGFAGLAYGWLKERNEKLRYLAMFIALTVGSVVPIIITTRYRLPVYPLLAIFAALAIVRWREKPRELLPFVLGGLTLVISFAGVDVLQQAGKISGRIQTLLGR